MGMQQGGMYGGYGGYQPSYQNAPMYQQPMGWGGQQGGYANYGQPWGNVGMPGGNPQPAQPPAGEVGIQPVESPTAPEGATPAPEQPQNFWQRDNFQGSPYSKILRQIGSFYGLNPADENFQFQDPQQQQPQVPMQQSPMQQWQSNYGQGSPFAQQMAMRNSMMRNMFGGYQGPPQTGQVAGMYPGQQQMEQQPQNSGAAAAVMPQPAPKSYQLGS